MSEKKDPIYTISYRCQICDYETIYSYKLHSKTQRVSTDYLLLTEYMGIHGFETVDLLTISVMICPRCLFASIREEDFVSLSHSKFKKETVQMSDRLRYELKQSTEAHRKLLNLYDVSENQFGRERNYRTAMVSYLLAAESARLKHEHGLEEALYELGHIYVRAAKMAEVAVNQEEETQFEPCVAEYLKEAAYYFGRSFEKEDYPPGETEATLYLAAVLPLYVDNPEASKGFFRLLDQYKRMNVKVLRDHCLDPVKIATYWSKAKDLLSEFKDP